MINPPHEAGFIPTAAPEVTQEDKLADRLEACVKAYPHYNQSLTAQKLGETALEAAAALRTLQAEVEELTETKEKMAALITAWEHAAGSLEAHLQDRIAMDDLAKPETYLSILRGDVRDLPTRSTQIYAATQYRSQSAEARATAAEAQVRELREALEWAMPYARNATTDYEGEAQAEAALAPKEPSATSCAPRRLIVERGERVS